MSLVVEDKMTQIFSYLFPYVFLVFYPLCFIQMLSFFFCFHPEVHLTSIMSQP